MTILNLFEGVWSQGGNWQSGEITLSKDHINIVTLLATLLHHLKMGKTLPEAQRTQGIASKT